MSWYIVADSDILVNNLSLLTKLKDIAMKGLGPPHIYIPWVVVRQIDRLSNHYQGRNAIRFLYETSRSEESRMHMESPGDLSTLPGDKGEVYNDRIVKCCTKLQSDLTDNKVVLLSNDDLLRQKAKHSNISAYSSDELLEAIKEINMEAPAEEGRADKESPADATLSVSYSTESREKNLKDIHALLEYTQTFLKTILEPFYKEEMRKAFAKRNVIRLKRPSNFAELIASVIEQWHPVFEAVMRHSRKVDFQLFQEMFCTDAGPECEKAKCLQVLKAVENVFHDVKGNSLGGMPSLATLKSTQKVCTHIISQMDSTSNVGESKADCIRQVLSGVLESLVRVGGLVAAFYQIPWVISMRKYSLPPKQEIDGLLCKIFPRVCQLKACTTRIATSPDDQTCQRLCTLLMENPPSLHEHLTPQNLKEYFLENADVLRKTNSLLICFYEKLKPQFNINHGIEDDFYEH